MKTKLIGIFLIGMMMSSCQKEIHKGESLTVDSISFKNRSPQSEGKYFYIIKIGNDLVPLYLGSDSVFKLGDTLKLVKQ